MEKHWTRAIRVALLSLFLYTTFSIHVTWQSLSTFILFLGSVYLFYGGKKKAKEEVDPFSMSTKQILDKLYPRVDKETLEHEVNKSVADLVTYDPINVTSVHNFLQIQNNTECIFARRAKIWGNQDWREHLSLEENVFRSTPTFLKFTLLCRQMKLDGFVFEIPTQQYSTNIQEFGRSFKRVLKTLSDMDPTEIRCMDVSYIGKRGWVFQFNKVTFFITTFADFYPDSHCRYSFDSENSFILFQPELSFALHDLSPDTTHTNYKKPKTERDRIRVAYRNAGREYKVPNDLGQPMAWDMIKPIRDDDPVIKWWE